MKLAKYYIINSITVYRIVAAPVLIILAIMGNLTVFKWLLPVSFFTDLIDGFLARKFKVTSILGTKLDSIGDDLSLLAAIVGIFVFKYDFILKNHIIIYTMLGLFLLQMILAFIRYGKVSSFHTYLSKLTMFFQGVFMIFIFILPQPVNWLFYTAAIVTVIDLVEEIIILYYLPNWETNVKGLYWVLKKINEQRQHKTSQ